MAFTSLQLHPSLLRNVKELGFTRPTPVQTDAIPAGLAGRDVLASAATGSGKTAAFLLPILHQLLARPRGTTRALILTPTRELAAQIAADLEELAADTPLRGAAVYGGVAMAPQVQAFRRGTDVIVATPGRLLDHMKSSTARFDDLEHLVLDEADRMLDMGFLPDIRRILRQLPARRQTLFFSATLPAPIAGLTRELLRDPVVIRLASKSAPAAGITQAAYPVAQELKAALLVSLLRRGVMSDALVFTRTKHRANRLALFLERAGIVVARIHGNRSQAQRTEALAGFKRGKYQVLVATDVAARGIDVAELGHVVNFDVPAAAEDYVHRVGRTGRAEAKGDAFTFVAPGEEAELGRIERAIGRRIPRVMVPDFDYQARPQGRLEVPISERLAASRRPSASRSAGSGRRTSGGFSAAPRGTTRPRRGRRARRGLPRT